MHNPSIMRRLLAILAAAVLFVGSGAGAYAIVADQTGASLAGAGVSVRTASGDTVDLSGLTRDEARARIRADVVAPLMRPVTVQLGGETLPELNPIDRRWAGVVTFDVERLLDDVFGPQEQRPFVQRVLQRVTGSASELTLESSKYSSVDESRTHEWVAEVAAQADRPARNAARHVENGRLIISPAADGVRTDQQAAANRLAEALLGTQRTVSWPAVSLEPTLTADSFDRTIVVDVSQRRLYLYAYAELDRSYRVAVGTPGFPTPLGEFQIMLKRYRPTWSNPGSDWAKDMPAYIPPGPGNPLGTRALNLSAPGIRIHGTEKVDSIGTAASHGCVRMLRANIEELYELVDVGTAVFIVP